jgi:hypothetical protein
MKAPITPRSQVKSALRKLWLRSRERARACKEAKYCCAKCGIKQSKAKGKEVRIEVHHKNIEIDWNALIDVIKKDLLCDWTELEVLCIDCHRNITYGNPTTTTNKQDTNFFR